MGLTKHGPLYRKLIWASLAALICSYALCALLLGGGTAETVRASVCKVGDGLTVSGFVVFREKAVGTGRLYPAVATGTQVSAGQCAAWRCEVGQEALCAEKRALRERFHALTAATAGSDAEIKAALHRLSLAPTSAAAQTLKNQILRREAVNADPAALQTTVEALRQRSKESELPAVNAGESGCFAYKTPSVLTPERLLGISPEEFARLRCEKVPSCRLITDDRWYFAALLPEERTLRVGQTLTVRLRPAPTVEMTVERLSITPAGQLLVLSSRENLAEVAALGQAEARLLLSTAEGLRVPKTAVRWLDGKTGVYVLVAGQVRFKPVTFLFEREDDFLAALTSGDPDALQPDDEILLHPQERHES